MLDQPILYGETVILRPICAEDADVFFASLTDRDLNYFTGTYQTFTFEQVKAHYARVVDADDRVDYAITSRENPSIVMGEVVLNDINWHNRSSSFRIALLSKKLFGKGYGTQATQLILQYGFENLALHRIDLEVYEFNPRAVYVYEKVGFKHEGVKRDALFWQGEYYNAILMSILKSDYYQL
ncbi:Protein N-acetyltransferase, RimJ/RimL family [Hyella patelloides LEGE 07179]|uniref:Protein N-acetyltransferase, RimJ/RimL family n=1 Tax=Hyella patelloides LEGE 07179 TaxID=945734 RepID=A0A563VWR0_9CYAN|nr:GNAT family protein [Hyella patelloides]VEP15860.1 Protein N-acetyltransferase, RimJ/RimL family [Hyella patelloides LEGE 07179]